jgi:hypothetical protein
MALGIKTIPQEKNHNSFVICNSKKLGHKKTDSILNTLERLIEKKKWRARAEKHPDIGNVFQVLQLEEGLLLFRVRCILNGKESHYELYSKTASNYHTAGFSIRNLCDAIKFLEGVSVR